MFDLQSGKCIYAEAFSSLFQEWLETPESELIKRSFENTLLVPFPKEKVRIEVSLRNKLGFYTPIIKHIVDPNDILIKKKGLKNIPEFTVMHDGCSQNINGCINIVILAEGYTTSEMDKFREHAQAATNALFEHTPFKKHKERFNIIAVETTSRESGVSVPKEDIWKETVFHSHFDTFYSDRYLTTSSVKDIHDAIAGIPYAHIIILANTNTYGGGGIFNAYTLTTTGNKDFKPIVVHEFGHSFGGLADEYYYNGDTFSDTYPLAIEPWEPNITTLTNFSSKWEKLLKANTPIPTNPKEGNQYPIGVFEGGGYSSKGIYRPAIDCRMKTNTCKDFCPACQKALEELIFFYTE